MTFFVDIYRTIGNEAQRGQSTLLKPADYRHFRRLFQGYWQPILDELRPPANSSVTTPRPRFSVKLKRFQIEWQKLGDVYELGGHLMGGDWSEREMLGCFNVECPCYGLKPLHKLRECKRCRTAHYCNVECQKK